MRRMRAILLVPILLLSSFIGIAAGATAADEPAMFRGEASGSGADPAARGRSADALAAVRFSFDAGSPIRPTPVVRDGLLYLAGGAGVLHALDAAPGAERWRHRAAGAITASPATDGRLVWLA